VAHAFDLAGTSNTVGAPSFVLFAKGGYHELLEVQILSPRPIFLSRFLGFHQQKPLDTIGIVPALRKEREERGTH
jgi:hypothetical protein